MNLSNRCRLCMNEDKLLVNIFDPDDSTDLLSKMIVCLPIQITDERSTISKYVCVRCVRAVEEIYQFWRTVASNNHFFLPKTAAGAAGAAAATNVIATKIRKSGPSLNAPVITPGSNLTTNPATANLIRNILARQQNCLPNSIKLVPGQTVSLVNGAGPRNGNGTVDNGKHKLSPSNAEQSFKKFVRIRKLAAPNANQVELVASSAAVSKANAKKFCRVVVPRTVQSVVGTATTAATVAAAAPKAQDSNGNHAIEQNDDSDDIQIISSDGAAAAAVADDNDGDGDGDGDGDELDDQQQQQPVEENGFDFASLMLSVGQQNVHVEDEVGTNAKLQPECCLVEEQFVPQPSAPTLPDNVQSFAEHGYSAQLSPQCFDLTD